MRQTKEITKLNRKFQAHQNTLLVDENEQQDLPPQSHLRI